MAKSEQFTFDGGAATYIGTAILGWIITAVTFGIGYPWSLCMFHKWVVEHTDFEDEAKPEGDLV